MVFGMASSKFVTQKRLIVAGILLVSFGLSIYRIIVIMNNIEQSPSAGNNNYYLLDNWQTYRFALVTVGAAALFLIAALFLGRRLKNQPFSVDPSVIFTSSLTGFLLLGAVFYYVFYYIDEPLEASSFVTGIIAFALISAVYFLMNASGKTGTGSRSLAWFSLAPIIFYALRLLNDFIRQSTTHNASSAPYLLLSLIAFLLFFLAEGKFRAGTGSITLYILFGSLALLLSLIYALPTLVLSAFWLFPADHTMLYAAIDLTVVMYISARICQLQCLEDAVCEAVPALNS